MSNTSYAVGVPAEQKVKPAFRVEKLEGERKTTISAFDPKKRKIVTKDVSEPAGYLVHFAKGHSNRLSADELDRLMKGDPTIKLVNVETGDVLGAIPA